MKPTQQRLDEFHEWIEKYEWQFNPVQFKDGVIYRWVNEACQSQLTTRELYDIFLELEQD